MVGGMKVRPTFFSQGEKVVAGWCDELGLFFILDEGGSLQRAFNVRQSFEAGQRVEFSEALDLHPSDYIERGERGVVSHVEQTTGVVSILLEGLHMGLGDNTLALVPHLDDETVNMIVVIKPSRRFTSISRMAALF